MPDLSLHIVLIARESTSLRLQHTLDSALSQTYEPKTVWVVNANPTDTQFSLGLLENLRHYPMVRLLPIAGQGTEFAIRNRVLQQIEGDFIAFMSDMDFWEPDRAAAQIAQLEENQNAGAAFANALELRETPNGIVGSALFEHAQPDPAEWLLQKTVAYGAQVTYRTAVLRAMQGFDEQLRLYGDLDVLVRIAGKQDVAISQQLTVKVHVPPLQDLRAQRFADNRYLLSKHMEFFLLHKSAAFDFCLSLARQALENRNTLLVLVYLMRAVVKQPLRAALLLVKQAGRRLWALLRKTTRGLLIRASVLRLKNRLFRGKEPRSPRPLGEEARGKETALTQLREYEFVRFGPMKFMRHKTLAHVKIPDYITVIPRGMFYGCKRLHTVEIPQTVTRIEASAFQNCERLKSVRFARGSVLESIGAYAFAGCVSLTELQLSGSLTSLGQGAFAGCGSLRGLSFASMRDREETLDAGFPSSLRTLAPYTFAGCVSMGRVAFQPGSMLETIEPFALLRCAGLELLRITGTVHTIGAYALHGCVQLGILDIPAIDSIQSIGKHAFEHCRSLDNLYIPHALKRIRACTFRGCLSLKRVKIPLGVKRIGRRAFAGCRLLDTVTLMDETTAYHRSSFPKKTQVLPYKPAAQA